MQNEFFEWDNDKAIANLNKHGVSFDEARTVFDDAFVIFIEDDRERYGEQRFQAIGVSQKGKLLTVGWTQRNNKMRIISAFKATKELRRLYEKTNNARY
ncbi:MAG: BrnT family toxin [Neisseriaceae bacterium]|nr:BrnT family toxin [Neisseriaceae bacterium]